MHRLLVGVVVTSLAVSCSATSGPQGPVGAAGPIGATGPEGPMGPQGLAGPAGQGGALVVLAGDGGTVIVDGGLAIVTGPPGPQGVQGVPGPQGVQGPPGGAGSFVDLTTAQTVGGAKTFTSTTTVTGATPFTDLILDSASTSAVSRVLAQVNGVNIGVFQGLGPTNTTTSRQNAVEVMNATPTGPVSLWAGGAERVRVTSTGAVGVNTPVPDATFVVTPPGSGSVRIGNVGCGGTSFAGLGLYGPLASCTNYTLLGDAAGNLYLNRPAGTGSTSFRSNNSDQVVIEPFGGLVVDAAGANAGALNHTAAANNGLAFGVGSGEGIASARSGTVNLFGLDFYTNFAKQLSITNSGKVGIGITGPGAKLQVVDNGTFDPTGVPLNTVLIGHARPFAGGIEGSGLCSAGATSGAPACMTVNNSHITWSQALSTGTGMKMDLDLAGGNLLIGGTLTQNSSASYKKDISYLDAEGLERALELVKQTPVATYRYKTMPEDAKVVYGVIAEQTPGALLAQDDRGVNLSTTIGVLLASVKAQQAHIEQLEARLARFEGPAAAPRRIRPGVRAHREP